MNLFNRHWLCVYYVYQAPVMCQARVHETQGPGSACKKGLEHLPLTGPECWLLWAEGRVGSGLSRAGIEGQKAHFLVWDLQEALDVGQEEESDWAA